MQIRRYGEARFSRLRAARSEENRTDQHANTASDHGRIVLLLSYAAPRLARGQVSARSLFCAFRRFALITDTADHSLLRSRYSPFRAHRDER